MRSISRILARKDYAHEAYTFGITPSDGPFFSGFFNLVPGALREFDGVFLIPIFLLSRRINFLGIRILRHTTQLKRLLQYRN